MIGRLTANSDTDKESTMAVPEERKLWRSATGQCSPDDSRIAKAPIKIKSTRGEFLI